MDREAIFNSRPIASGEGQGRARRFLQGCLVEPQPRGPGIIHRVLSSRNGVAELRCARAEGARELLVIQLELAHFDTFAPIQARSSRRRAQPVQLRSGEDGARSACTAVRAQGQGRRCSRARRWPRCDRLWRRSAFRTKSEQAHRHLLAVLHAPECRRATRPTVGCPRHPANPRFGGCGSPMCGALRRRHPGESRDDVSLRPTHPVTPPGRSARSARHRRPAGSP